jgi:pyruvate dehydrogenase E2 component (dihydrolipoamide acetyltransferase)
MPLKPGPEPEYELLEHTPTRAAIAARTQASFRDVPQFSVTVLVDAEAMVAARQRLKAAGGPTPSYNDIIIRAVAEVIGEHPRFNAWYAPEGLKLLKSVNIGFAAATEAGVLLPTVYDAAGKSLAEIAAETAELIELARAGKLRASLQRNAGFTITNIGPTGVEWFHGIIAEPQAAILAVGSLAPRALVVEGRLAVRQSMYLTLTTDHRCADGAEAAAFLGDLAKRLEQGIAAA